ncbi:hypothetical protein evm_014684, partial [Chilo suppressalis]
RMRYPLPYALVTEMEARAPHPPPAAALARRALHALTTPAPHQVYTHRPAHYEHRHMRHPLPLRRARARTPPPARRARAPRLHPPSPPPRAAPASTHAAPAAARAPHPPPAAALARRALHALTTPAPHQHRHMRHPLPYALVTEMEARAPHPPPAAALARRALHALTTPAPHQSSEVCYSECSSDKGEDFLDPTRKTPCTCAKWRRRRTGRAPRPEPFHRRPVVPPRARSHNHAHAVTRPQAL